MKNVLLIGGDLRQRYLAEDIEKTGTNTSVYFENNKDLSSLEEKIKNSDIIVCPVPFTKDKKNIFSTQCSTDLDIEDFLNYINSKHTVFGGNIPQNIKTNFKEKGVNYVDFMNIEEVSIKNAIATAEGTIAEAIRHSSINIHNSKCLVLGYGRCGKVIAQKLKALDAHVTIADRSEEKLANGFSFGLETADIYNLEGTIDNFDFIFNTVPKLLIKKNIIDLMKKDVVIIDISSAPGGVDFEYCKALGINANLCLGLPGKYSPKTSADILFGAIKKYL